MSSITNKKLGYDDLNDYIAISSETSSNLVKVDVNTGGWNFKGDNNDYAYLSVMEEQPMTVSQILSIQFLIDLKDVTYGHIPFLQIRTQPTGSGDYSPGEFHDEVRYKVRDNNTYVKNNQLIMFYNKYELEHIDTTTTRHEKMVLLATLGTPDANLPIQSIRLVQGGLRPFNYTVLAISHDSNGVNRRQERITLSNYNINNSIKNVETSVKVLENRTQYQSHRGRSQIFLGTTGATLLLADSTIIPRADPSFRDGMYFQNTVSGTKYNLYKFGGTAEVIRYSHIENIYAKLFIDGASMPFFHIYTKPLGDGTDAQPWYNSKWTYTFNYTNFTSLGVECVLYAGVNKPTLDIDFNVQQYKHTDVAIDGTGNDGEILYMSIASDSGATINTVSHCINLVGFKSDDDNGVITEKNFDLVAKVGQNISAFDDVTNTFKVLKSNTEGLLKTLIFSQQDILTYENPAWTAGSFTDPFDLSGASKVRIYGNVGTNNKLEIQYASVLNAGVYDWQFISEVDPTSLAGNISIDLFLDCPPKYLRIENSSNSTQSVSLRVVKH